MAIDMEATALGDHYINKDNLGVEQTTYPLDVYYCHECGHMQVSDVIDPSIVYGNYLYETSHSLGLDAHFKNYAKDVVHKYSLSESDLVIDIGCNDGTFLKEFKNNGCRVLGIDPLEETAKKNIAAGIDTIVTFFNKETANIIRKDYGSAKIITANNVMANVDDMVDFVSGIRELLAPDGIFIFETGYLVGLINNNVIDNIYHEHLSYFRVNPLIKFFENNGMKVIDIQDSPTKGGSIRGIVKMSAASHGINKSVKTFYEAENNSQFADIEKYKQFSEQMLKNKDKLNDILNELNGKNVGGFGASVGVTTLIYYWGLGDKIKVLYDDNPIRHGLYSPGYHLPVHSPDMMSNDEIDVLLIFAWRYVEPILSKHKALKKQVEKIILPLPAAELILK